MDFFLILSNSNLDQKSRIGSCWMEELSQKGFRSESMMEMEFVNEFLKSLFENGVCEFR